MNHSYDGISVSLVVLTAHRFIFLDDEESCGYWDFWQRQDQIPGRDCDTITGLLDGIEGKLDGPDQVKGAFSGQVMARLYREQGSTECYGARLDPQYDGPVPAPLLLIDVPEADYLAFEHGPFDYEKEGDQVDRLLRSALDHFSFDKLDFEPDNRPGRLAYYYFEPDRYARYLLPVRAKTIDCS